MMNSADVVEVDEGKKKKKGWREVRGKRSREGVA